MKNELELIKQILKALIKLRSAAENGNVPYPYFGICFNCDKIIYNSSESTNEDVYAFLKNLFIGWEKHSGNPDHPVPRTEDCWEWEGLLLRKDLLNYSINKLETLLKTYA